MIFVHVVYILDTDNDDWMAIIHNTFHISVRHNHLCLFSTRWSKILCRDLCSTPTVLEHTSTILLSNFLLCRFTLPYQHMRHNVTEVTTHNW